jgi:hypothetical protein
LVALYQYASSVASGEAEGVLAALLLLAFLRYLDGAPRQALALAFTAALIRPETWPFVAVYGVYLWRRDLASGPLLGALLGLVAVLWFGPELWGSGSLLRGVRWAQYARAGSPALARCPFCAELTDSAWGLLAMPFKVGLALVAAVTLTRRPRRWRVTLVVAMLGLAWILEEAVLTQIGFSGSDRYLIAPMALLIVCGSVGLGSVLSRPRWSTAVAAAAVLLTVLAPGKGPHWGGAVQAAREQDAVRADLSQAVDQAGGPRRLLSCGGVQTIPSEAPLAAWTLDVPLRRTESSAGNVVIQSAGWGSAARLPVAPRRFRLAAASGGVKIFEDCG